ncbi:MAG: sigma-70 family RNA polymerase sigma factor [Actinomycetota bacterium]|nr:sigma-70 family RNA polymerase sigma factor [Actinomycetota bacterium]
MTDRTSDDQDLVVRLIEGDDSALKEVIVAYGAAVFAAAATVTKDLAIAEEVAQDTFLALWMQADRFDADIGSLRAYLLRIARYKAIDRVRQHEARRQRDHASTQDRSNDPETKRESAIVEERERVQSALTQLSPVQRDMILLTYFLGRTRTEAAAELGIPEGTAKTRLRDALIKLRSLREDI